MNTVSIDKVELKIGKKTITLSLAELKDLKAELDKLFPTPIVVDRPYPVSVPVWPPIWIRQPEPFPYWTTKYTSNSQCTVQGGTLQLSLNN